MRKEEVCVQHSVSSTSDKRRHHDTTNEKNANMLGKRIVGRCGIRVDAGNEVHAVGCRGEADMVLYKCDQDR